MGFESVVGGNPSTQADSGSGQHLWQPAKMSDILNTTFGKPPELTNTAAPQTVPADATTALKFSGDPAALTTALTDAWKLPPVVVPPMTTDGTPAKAADPTPDDTSESKTSKVLRESLVLGGGLGRSVVYGLASLPQRLPEIGASMAIGAALSTLSKVGGLGTAATFVVGAYFTSKFIVNAINDKARWNKFGAAVTDTWNTNQHIMKDIRDVSDSGGNFAFDTGLSMASGYVGYNNKALGELILGVIKLPIPAPLETPMPPAFLGAAMYMDVVPAPFLYKDVRDDDAIHKRQTQKPEGPN